jgi:hypothetical protein
MRHALLILPGILLAVCASAGMTALPPTAAPADAPTATVSRPPSPSPSSAIPLKTATPIPTSTASVSPHASASLTPGAATSAPLVKGWPTVSRSGVTMTGRDVGEPPPFEGSPGAAPAVTLAITMTGLTPGESVSLTGTGAYDFLTLGCGVEPSPCELGSDTTDPTVHLCKPEYAQAAKGTAKTAGQATAGADGKATATLRFVMSESERACPAGPSRPWYVESGEWKLRVTDNAHGLRLVGPPDYIIGP